MAEKDFRVKKGLQVEGTGDSSIAGNLGIGTTSPGHLLDVTGNARVGKTSTAGYLYLSADSAGSYLGWNADGSDVTLRADDDLILRADDDMLFKNGSTTNMVLTSDARVGIGTTTPNLPLEIKGVGTDISTTVAGYKSHLLIVDQSDYDTPYNGGAILFGGKEDADDNVGYWAKISGEKANTSPNNFSGTLNFWTRKTGGNPTQRMVIDEDGNVGIGTDSPDSKLDISHSSSPTLTIQTTATSSQQANLTLHGARNAENTIGQITFSNIDSTDNPDVTYNAARILAFNDGGLNAGGIKFQTVPSGSSTTLATAMTITENSSAGIGTTAPSTRLHVAQTGTADLTALTLDNGLDTDGGKSVGMDLRVRYASSNIATSYIGFDYYGTKLGGNSHGMIYRSGRAGFAHHHFVADDNTRQMMIADDGNVGIGSVFTHASQPNTPLASNAKGLVIAGTGGQSGSAQDGSERIPTLVLYDTVTDYGSNTATVGEARGSIEFYSSETSNNYPGIAASIKAINESTYNSAMGLGLFTSNNLATATEKVRINADGQLLVGKTTSIASIDRKLEVEGSIAAASGGSGGVGFHMKNSEGEFLVYTDGGALIVKDYAGSDTYPFKIEGTAENDTLVVNTGGDVTIKDQLILGSEIIHSGDTNNKIAFGTDTQTFTTAGSARMTIEADGDIAMTEDLDVAKHFSFDTQHVGGSAGGSTGTENGANTWCKILEWDHGTTQYRDLSLTLGITEVDVGSQNQAIIAVYGRSHATNSNLTMGVKIISLISASHLRDDSFKIINNGWGTPIQLWMKKYGTYGTFNWNEIAKKVGGSTTLTYSSNSAWQSTEPASTANPVQELRSYGTVIEGRQSVLNLYHNQNVSQLSANDVLSTISFRKHTSHGGNETIRIYNVQGDSGSSGASDDYHTSDLRISTRQIGTDSYLDRFTILGQEGYVGIGTTSPDAPLHVEHSSGLIAKFGEGNVETQMTFADSRASVGYHGDALTLQSGSGSKFIKFCVNNGTFGSGEAARFDTSGNFGIGTTSPASELHVVGHIQATTKSFVIDHPSKEGMTLRHGSLEGPEHAVYIRGQTKGNLIDLPDYWSDLVDEDSITVQLTPKLYHQNLYVRSVDSEKVVVGSSEDTTPEFYYLIHAERKDVDKMVVEY